MCLSILPLLYDFTTGCLSTRGISPSGDAHPRLLLMSGRVIQPAQHNIPFAFIIRLPNPSHIFSGWKNLNMEIIWEKNRLRVDEAKERKKWKRNIENVVENVLFCFPCNENRHNWEFNSFFFHSFSFRFRFPPPLQIHSKVMHN